MFITSLLNRCYNPVTKTDRLYYCPFLIFSRYSLGENPNSSLNTLVKYFGVENPTRIPSSATLMFGSCLAMRHASLRRTEEMNEVMFCPVTALSLLYSEEELRHMSCANDSRSYSPMFAFTHSIALLRNTSSGLL